MLTGIQSQLEQMIFKLQLNSLLVSSQTIHLPLRVLINRYKIILEYVRYKILLIEWENNGFTNLSKLIGNKNTNKLKKS